jgi:hypothetical protein
VIPEEINALEMIETLNTWGWKDFQIEEECKFSKGYISHLRSGRIKVLLYPTAARLVNFHEKNVPRVTISENETKTTA